MLSKRHFTLVHYTLKPKTYESFASINNKKYLKKILSSKFPSFIYAIGEKTQIMAVLITVRFQLY